MSSSRWISLEEAAEHLGIKPTTLYKWLERKQLPGHKVGRLWKFKIEELDEWVRSNKGDANKDQKLGRKIFENSPS